jgi:uncharacterized protein (UPF0264 family)
MTSMTLRVVNATFESISAGEFETVDDAFRAATAAGLEIAAGEVRNGTHSVIVEVAVDLVGQRGAVRGAVAISTARFRDASPD